MFQMLSHGIVSAALFLCVGVVYDRMHTREIAVYGGLVHRMPRYAFVFMFFTLASVGLPGLSGFVGEFLVLLGTFKVNTWVAFLAATGADPGRGLCAVALSQDHLRRAHQGSLKAILDMNRARGRGVPAAGAADACGWASIPTPSSIRWRRPSTSWSATIRRPSSSPAPRRWRRERPGVHGHDRSVSNPGRWHGRSSSSPSSRRCC